jgi:hypothetical protein
MESLAAQVTQSRLTFIIGGHRLAARRYNICVADSGIGGGVGGRIFLFAGHLSPGSGLVYGHVDAVHNQLDQLRKYLKQCCGSALVSMRIRIRFRIKLYSSTLGAKPLRIHAVHSQLDRAGETITKLFTKKVWIRIGFSTDSDQAF